MTEQPPPQHATSSPGSAVVWASDGYRRLASRVIHQALRDLDGPSIADRDSARAFLAGSPMLFFWCDLAEINAVRVIARARTEWPRLGASRPVRLIAHPLPSSQA